MSISVDIYVVPRMKRTYTWIGYHYLAYFAMTASRFL